MNFTSGESLLKLCKDNNGHIADIMLAREIELTGKSKLQIYDKIDASLNVMFTSIDKGIENSRRSLGGLIGGEAKRINAHIENNTTYYIPPEVLKIAAYSMAVMEVNAIMGVIVAAPTAGSSGILPAVLKHLSENTKTAGGCDYKLSRAFLTAGAIGLIVTNNASVSGAEGGCQAEIGTATAMSAAALTYFKGGSPEQCLDAATFTFKNIMGLACDPIAGLVEVPCQKRNALGVLNAMLCADFSLMGIKAVLPFDEVIEAMHRVGKTMPIAVKETALGGVAACPSAKEIEFKIFNKTNNQK